MDKSCASVPSSLPLLISHFLLSLHFISCLEFLLPLGPSLARRIIPFPVLLMIVYR